MKTLEKPGNSDLPPKTFLCGPHFFRRQRKVLHCNRVVYGVSSQNSIGGHMHSVINSPDKKVSSNPGQRHSRVTRDDGTVTLCTLSTATVLSRNCCADFGRPLTKKVMSHSHDGPDGTIADKHCTSHGGVESPPLLLPPP